MSERDAVVRAREALDGITPGEWVARVALDEPSKEAHAEWMADTLGESGRPLSVVIAPSDDPSYAYVVPAVTGDGPRSATNAALIAAAPALVRDLVAEVDRLRGTLDVQCAARDTAQQWAAWFAAERDQVRHTAGTAWAKEYSAARQAEAGIERLRAQLVEAQGDVVRLAALVESGKTSTAVAVAEAAREVEARIRAEEVVDGVRAAVGRHPDPDCDLHPDGDIISCGWKHAYRDVLRALRGES